VHTVSEYEAELSDRFHFNHQSLQQSNHRTMQRKPLRTNVTEIHSTHATFGTVVWQFTQIFPADDCCCSAEQSCLELSSASAAESSKRRERNCRLQCRHIMKLQLLLTVQCNAMSADVTAGYLAQGERRKSVDDRQVSVRGRRSHQR
jgi:hypothetical protein